MPCSPERCGNRGVEPLVSSRRERPTTDRTTRSQRVEVWGPGSTGQRHLRAVVRITPRGQAMGRPVELRLRSAGCEESSSWSLHSHRTATPAMHTDRRCRAFRLTDTTRFALSTADRLLQPVNRDSHGNKTQEIQTLSVRYTVD